MEYLFKRDRQTAAKAIAAAVVAASLLVMLGWLFNIQWLKSAAPFEISIKFNAAVCFAACGINLYLFCGGNYRKNILYHFCSAVIFLVAVATLLQYFLGLNWGIDEMFWKPAPEAATSYPGRMSLTTAINFLFVAGLFYFLSGKKHQWWVIANLFFVVGLNLLMIFNQLFGNIFLDFLPSIYHTAFYAAVLFLLVCSGIYFAIKKEYFHTTFTQKIAVYFGVVVLLLSFIFSAFFINQKELISSTRSVSHKERVLLVSQQMLSQSDEIENGVRGYLLTEDSALLQPFISAKKELPILVEKAREITAGNKLQSARINEMDSLIKKSINIREKFVNLANSEGFGVAVAELKKGEGTRVSLQIRDLNAQLQAEENRMLGLSREKGREVMRNTVNSTITLVGITTLLLYFTFRLINRNIQARNIAEKNLHTNELFINSIINNTNNPISIRDLKGKYLLVNKPLEQLLNKPREEIIGRSVYDVLPEETATTLLKKDNEIIHFKRLVEVEERLALANDVRYFSMCRFPLFDDKDNVYAVGSVSTDVTRRKLAEKELEIFKHFFNNSFDFSSISNFEGFIEIVNPAFCQMVGFTAEELTQEPFLRFIHPDDIPASIEALQQLKDGIHVRGMLARFRKKDGLYLWTDWTVAPDLEAKKLYAIGRNITEKKKLEDELKELNSSLELKVRQKTDELLKAEIHFKTILEDLIEGIQIIGFDWKTKYVNTSLVKHSRTTKEALLGGKTIMELYPGIEHSEVFGAYKTCMEKRVPQRLETEFKFPDGVTNWFYITVQPVHEGIFVLTMDVNQRKKAEERLQLALEAGRIGWWELDLQTGEVIRNELHDEIFGYTEPLKKWTKTIFFRHIHPADLFKTRAAFEKAFTTQVLILEARIIWPDKSVHWVNLRGRLVTGGAEKGRIFGTLIDITERKNAEEKLFHYAEELKTSNTELERFAYIASHDLQEPLRMVSSFLNLLEKNLASRLDPSSRQYMDFALDGSERMKSLIQSLLQYARVGSNRDGFEETDLNNTILHVSRLYQEKLQDKNGTIEADRLPTIYGNKVLLKQLFTCLISNAIKFNLEKPLIEIGCREEDRSWLVYVKDNGIGIDPKFYEKVFVIFQRLNSKQEYSGTGIGLAICKKIMDIHKGKIWIQSLPERGSTFFLTFPKNLSYE